MVDYREISRAGNFSKYLSNGFQWVKNLSDEPLMENFIFSNFKSPKISCSQTLINGGWDDFHNNKILFLAMRETKAIRLFWIAVVWRLFGGLPNIAICGVGVNFILNISEIILKNWCQNSKSLGHAQNIWVRLQGICEHLLHLSSNLSGYNFDNFSLL